MGSRHERARRRGIQGDTAKFRQALTDRIGEFGKIAADARTRARSIAASEQGTASWWPPASGSRPDSSGSSSPAPNSRRSSHRQAPSPARRDHRLRRRRVSGPVL